MTILISKRLILLEFLYKRKIKGVKNCKLCNVFATPLSRTSTYMSKQQLLKKPTHTHTFVHTHCYTHTHTHTDIWLNLHEEQPHTHTLAHKHSYTHTHTHTHRGTHTTHTDAHTRTHAHIHTQILTHICHAASFSAKHKTTPLLQQLSTRTLLYNCKRRIWRIWSL